MTALEVHIDFNLKLQNVAANINRDFENEEVDILINQAARQFVINNVVPKPMQSVDGVIPFQSDKKNFDDLEELVKVATLPVYQKDNESVYAFLPKDYFLILDDVSKITDYCKTKTFTTTTVTKYIAIVPLNNDEDNTSPNLFEDFAINRIGGGATTLFDINDYVSIYNPDIVTTNGLIDNDLKFFIINLVLQKVNESNNIEVRWERYGNLIYQDNAFIFISDTPFTSIDLNLNGGESYDAETYQLNVVTPLTGGISRIKSNRLVKSEYIRNMLNNPLGKTISDSPVSTMQEGIIRVYHDNTFMINEIELIYIKKPRLMNLGLGQVFDFNSNRKDKIIDLAVQRAGAYALSSNIKGIMENNKDIIQ